MDSRHSMVFRLFRTSLRLVAAGVLAIVVVPPVSGAVAVSTLLHAPLPVGELPDKQPEIEAVASLVYDGAGNRIGVFRGFDETVAVAPDDIPQVLKDASVAIEDKRFWEHNGIDYEGIARAARVNLAAGGVAQGGSTLTQQYVKNVYLSQERTLERKVDEALLAREIEQQLSKEEILFGYLTSSYYGSGAYGVGAGAKIYFNKSVDELDISEAATLAGVVKAPTRLSPFVDIEATEERRRLVLAAMYEQGYIDESDYERNLARTLWSLADSADPVGPVTLVVPRPKKGASRFPHFVDLVEAELTEQLGPDMIYTAGLTIETTIDPELQREAESAVADRLENTEAPIEMALVSVDPADGHIKAMVAGRDYAVSQVNLATGGSTGFQPGSSFKPLVLAAAIDAGLAPETRYPAPARWLVPGCQGDECSVSNYDFNDYGDITLREAMRASVNTVFGQLVLDVGLGKTVTLARQLGLDYAPDRGYGPSLALGAVETSPLAMASAYGAFANRGVRAEPTAVARVIDADGNVLIDNRARRGAKVMTPSTADNVTDVLVDVIADGTGKRADIGRPAAGKTGTAQAYRAAWFVGYTPQLSTAVWMGHSDRLESLINVNGVGRVTGGSHPAVAWRDFMVAAHEDLPVVEFPEPVEIEPIAETAEEMVTFRVREYTRVAARRTPASLSTGCAASSCSIDLIGDIALAPSQIPTVAQRRAAARSSSATSPTTVNRQRPTTTAGTSPSVVGRPSASSPPTTRRTVTTTPTTAAPTTSAPTTSQRTSTMPTTTTTTQSTTTQATSPDPSSSDTATGDDAEIQN